MAITYQKIIIGVLILLVSTSIIYISMQDKVKIRVDNDKTTFYVKEDGKWLTSGVEYVSIYNGSTKLIREASNINVTQITNENDVRIIRTTPFKSGARIVDTYYFRGDVESIELFPIKHTVEVFNAKNKYLRYEVKNLFYSGKSYSLSGETELSFGRNMKLTLNSGYKWAKVVALALGGANVRAQYQIKSDYEMFEFRLFDPPVVTSAQLNATTSLNLTTDNLTVYVTTDVPANLTYDWRKNGKSDATLNMPFDINGSNGNQTNVKDYTTNSSNGTKIWNNTNPGTTWNASCGAFSSSGGCYQFDGIDDSIYVPFTTVDGQYLTVSAWVKPISLPVTTIKPFIAIDSGGRVFDLFIYAPDLWGYVWNSTGSLFQPTATTDLQFNNWSFVAMTVNSTSVGLWINGILDSTKAMTGGLEGKTSYVTLGFSPQLVMYGYYNGSIDQVNIWNRSLSANEIAMIYNGSKGKYNSIHSDVTTNGDTWGVAVTPNDGTEEGTTVVSNNVTINTPPSISSVIVNATTSNNLTAYPQGVTDANGDNVNLVYDWRKNGVSDAILNLPFDFNHSAVKDYSSFNSNGTALNGARFNSSCNAFSGSGGCYEFDGINDNLNFTQTNNLKMTDNFSVSFWVKPNTMTNYDGILGKTSTSSWNDGFGIYYLANKIYAFVNNFNLNSTSTGTINKGKWYFVVMTYNRLNLSLYLNGSRVSVNNIADRFKDSNVSFRVGMVQPTYMGNQSIDQVVLWNRSLSSDEIAMLYNGSLGKYNSVHSDATTAGDVWGVSVTPNDGKEEGNAVLSNQITILESAIGRFNNIIAVMDNWFTSIITRGDAL